MTLEQAVLMTTTAIAVIGLGVTLVKMRSERRKMASEAKKIDVDTIAVISSSAIALLAPMETKVKNLSVELAQSTAALAATTAELVSTKAELVSTKETLDSAVGRIADLEASVTELVKRLRHYENDRDGLEHEGGLDGG